MPHHYATADFTMVPAVVLHILESIDTLGNRRNANEEEETGVQWQTRGYIPTRVKFQAGPAALFYFFVTLVSLRKNERINIGQR